MGPDVQSSTCSPATVRRPPPDRGLVDRARRGEDAAWSELFRIHHARVLAAVRTRVTDQSAVADIAQEVFLAAFTNLERFRGHADLATWLFRIAINTASTYMDRQRRWHARAQTLGELPRSGPAAPDELLDTARAAERISSAMRGLSEEHRRSFVGHRIDGMTYDALARELGVSPATVWNRARRVEVLLRSAGELTLPSAERGTLENGRAR